MVDERSREPYLYATRAARVAVAVFPSADGAGEVSEEADRAEKQRIASSREEGRSR